MRSSPSRRHRSAAVLLAVAFALVVPSAAYAGKGGGGLTNSTVYKVDVVHYTDDVCPTAAGGIPSGSGDGTFMHIQAAIECAESWGGGFTIQVAPGTYNENLLLGVYGYPNSLTIVGTGGAANTIIDGQQNGPVIASGFEAYTCAIGECWQVTATIRGFTLRNGSGIPMTGYGFDEYVGPTVVVGGGVYNGPGSNLTLANDIVTGNDISNISNGSGGRFFSMGGGIFTDAFAKLTLSATTVTGNKASAGGGIADAPLWYECPMHYCFTGDVHVQSSSVITNNQATEFGGGLMMTTHASMTVDSSDLSYNQAGPASEQWAFPWPSGLGGAIASVPSIWHDPYAPGGQTSLSGVNITHNSGPAGGGAIANLGGQLTMSGGTMANNTAANGPGGGILNIYESSASIRTPNINANTAGTVGGGIANCLQSTMNLSGGKILSNVAGSAAPSGGGINAEETSPWSAVNTAIRNNLPDQKAAVSCGIEILLPAY